MSSPRKARCLSAPASALQVNTLFTLMGEKKEDDEFVLQVGLELGVQCVCVSQQGSQERENLFSQEHSSPDTFEIEMDVTYVMVKL